LLLEELVALVLLLLWSVVEGVVWVLGVLLCVLGEALCELGEVLCVLLGEAL
jgi:hypothetical protein